MHTTRRKVLAIGSGTLAFALTGLPAFANATDERIVAFTGGVDVMEDGAVELIAPEIAENGNTVPIEVAAPGAEAIMVLAAGNPNPDVGTFNFGPLAAEQMASTRIRLAETQDVVAIARMPDGTFHRTSQEVKVTIGGCGG